jgi:GT2 family glycosyltransferase
MFSFIVLYRNREIERVKRCLQSIVNQTNKDFEIIFLDYGSEPNQSEMVAAYCQNLPLIRYVYAPTQGWFWCRSHALNLGVAAATQPYVIIVDIDIVYCPHFVAYLAAKVNQTTYFNYACYYLPQDFTDYAGLDYQRSYPYTVSDFSGTGLLIAPTKVLEEVGGFDTIFKIWGFEDRDIFHRLEDKGLQNIRISITDLPTFHQWHHSANQIEAMPKSWLDFMRKCWEQKPKGVAPHPHPEQLFDLVSRPALQLVQGQKNVNQHFIFSYPLTRSYLEFVHLFSLLQSGQSLQIKQSFQAIPPQAPSVTARVFRKVNKLFEKINISYRVTELLVAETELITFFQVRDFLFYFLYSFENQIADYYWKQQQVETIEFIVVKK